MKLSALAVLVLAALLAVLLWKRSDTAPDRAAAEPATAGRVDERVGVEPELDVEPTGAARTAIVSAERTEPEADEGEEAEPLDGGLGAWIELIVLDEADGAPVAEARVLANETETSGLELVASAAAERDFEEQGTSDGRGRFVLESARFAKRWVRVEASGYGAALLKLPAERSANDPPLVVRVRRTATLAGRVESSGGAPARVRLSSAMYRLLSDASAESYIGGELRRGARCDEQGRFELDQLPSGVPFVVDLVSEGWPTRRLSDPLILEPGERREVSWQLDAAANVDVLALDARGYPAAGVQLRLIRADEVYGDLVQAYVAEVATTVTDAGGLARFERVAQGDWVIAPAGSGRIGSGSTGGDGYASEAARFTVGAEDERVELELTLHFGRTIGGQVFAPDGSPAPGARVSIRHGSRRLFAFEQADEEGRFRSGPLVPGTYRISAEPGSQTPGASRSVELEVEVDADDLVLNLRQAARLVVELRDAVSGRLEPGQLILTELDTGRISMPQSSGVKTFDNLPPGAYELTGLAGNGGVGLVDRFTLEIAADSREIVVPLEPGGRVRVAYRGEHDVLQVRVLAGDQVVSLDGLERGLQKTLAAPAGRVTVRGTVYLDERDPSGEVLKIVRERDVDVPAGGVVDVVFD